ncbi:TlpA family protein disulfide reductase [Anaeromyxobacter diazotrophicus]|uniref:TlpA family protein disulfide reductase n=1 Tax=Anaeromyxobacter diazotrophicus TaxID=2590199 RepID=UPI001590126A|nr:TlpA disulfide reductase family protein [Anaeromyxobacter diazotrophicus]
MPSDSTRSGRRWPWVAALAVGLVAVALLIAQALNGAAPKAPGRAAAPLPAPPPFAGPEAGAHHAFTPEEARAAEGRLLDEAAFTHPVDVAAPDVTVTGADGKPVRLSALRGQVLFVNFWATWCPPCVQEMPSMLQLGRALAAAHPGRFKMVAVSGDDGWEAVHAYFKQAFGGAPKELLLARDEGAQAARSFYCAARGYCPDVKFPETYIVDRSGKVVAMIVGPRDWADPGFRQWLEFVIAG